MKPVRFQEALVLQNARDAAVIAALTALNNAKEAARLQSLVVDLESLGFKKCDCDDANNIFKLSFSASLTQDDGSHEWFNHQDLAVIEDGAMYTGTSGAAGVANVGDGLMAFDVLDFEVGLTVKLDVLPSGGCALIDSFKSQTMGGNGFQLYVYSDGRLSFYQKNTPLNEVITGVVIQTGVYIDLKVKRKNGIVYLFVNNTVRASGAMAVDFDVPFTAIGYQYLDHGNGQYPSRGHFKNVYAKWL